MRVLALLVACSPTARPPAAAGDTAPPIDDGCPYVPPATWPGCAVGVSRAPGADALPTEVERTAYDTDARAISWEYRDLGDSTQDLRCAWTWTGRAGPDGDPWPLDERCLGRSTWTYAWAYDDDGLPASKTYDRESDGAIDRTWTWTTDPEGRILQEEVDEDVDGTPDALNAWEYDAEGLLAREAWDYQADGVADHVRTYTWAEAGSGPILVERRDDDGGDGTVDAVTAWSYDPAGNLLVEGADEDADGDDELTTTWTWGPAPGDTCRVDRVEESEVGAGTWVSRYSWSPEGRLDRVDHDWLDDGVVDQVDRYSYGCGR